MSWRLTPSFFPLGFHFHQGLAKLCSYNRLHPPTIPTMPRLLSLHPQCIVELMRSFRFYTELKRSDEKFIRSPKKHFQLEACRGFFSSDCPTQNIFAFLVEISNVNRHILCFQISDIRLHFRGGACHSCCYFYPPNAIFSSIQLFKQFLDSFRPTLCKS